jgi:hypothetical protein
MDKALPVKAFGALVECNRVAIPKETRGWL